MNESTAGMPITIPDPKARQRELRLQKFTSRLPVPIFNLWHQSADQRHMSYEGWLEEAIKAYARQIGGRK